MKGIVFTEFLEMVEEKFGLETLDFIIENSNLKSKAIYTAVGTYDAAEMFELIHNLSEKSDIAAGNLIYAYGHYFFKKLVESHANIFEMYTSPIDLLNAIESHIHVHVRKIYKDAELPSFDVIEKSDTKITMIYQSERSLYMFAKGLMEKTFEHYGKNATVNFEVLDKFGKRVKFEAILNE
ncbi:heme NO-binding domain-containing protein [Ascidiimonas sp. W6]|uniref:heme NO-binding domain-containing protein n=1 Tax=Ascidiimonas meishanensis TaxID=3128903 RepID=UPI0030ED4850